MRNVHTVSCTVDHNSTTQAQRGDPAKPWFEGQRKRARVVRRAKDYVKVRRGLRGAECSSLGRASSSVVLVLPKSHHRVSLTRAIGTKGSSVNFFNNESADIPY